MHIGCAYGLIIHSELYLPEIFPADGEPDVVISKQNLADIKIEDLNDDVCVLDAPEIGRFLIQNSQRIIVDPLPNVEDELLRAVLLGSVFATLLRQRGLLVLHASSIVIGDSAIAFLGGSGWGKSTMVKFLHSRGHSVISDDVMAVHMERQITVIPSYPQIKLLPDTATFLGHSFEDLAHLYSQASKRAHRFREGFQQIPVPLKRLYLLARGKHNTIKPLSQKDAFIALIQHSRALQYLPEQKFSKLHFTQCEKLVKSIPISALARESSLNKLPDLAELIEKDIFARA